MRIVAGKLGSRIIAVPAGIRPTQDRVRAAIFSMLGERIVGSRVLDLFAGTGALGLEAWSRGADEVCWVEQDSVVHRTLRKNIATLCGEPISRLNAVRADVWRFLERAAGAPYDFILADPPYDHHTTAFDHGRFLSVLLEKGWAGVNTWLVFEQRAGGPEADHPAWSLMKDRKYSDTRITVYRCVENSRS